MTQQWYDNPIEFQPTELTLQRYWDEERQKQRQNYFDLPMRGEWDRDIAASGAMWFDINNKQEAYRGLLDHSVATDDSMAEDYTQGYLADNSNHVRYVARNIQSLYAGTDYSGSILDIDPDTEGIIQEGVALSGWNVKDQLTGSMIGIDITDLLNMDPPDGWSPEEALDIFEERDPRRYGNYITLFRDKRQLLSIIEEAKNPIDFFYRLSNAAHKIQISQSIQHYNENTSVVPWAANWTKTLIVNGIINDPDLASSTGISLALGVLTGGTSLIGSAAWHGVRSIKTARRAFRLTRWTRSAQNYLPETIGPHLLRKFLWKNTYKDAGFWGRTWRNIPGNIGEGLLTGFAAEVSNQHRRVHLRYQKEFDWTRVGWETVFEGALSPFINPGIGRIYRGVGIAGQGVGFGVNWASPRWLGGQGGMLGGRGREDYGAFVTFAKKTLKKSAKFSDPNYAEAWLTHMEILEELGGDLDTLLGNEQGITIFGEPDPATGLLEHPVLMLETLFDEYGVPPQRRMEILKRSLQRLKAVMKGKTYGTPTDLMLAVADDLGSNERSIAKYATTPEGRSAIQRVKAHVYLISQLANYAAEEGITLVEAHERLLKDENYYEVLVDNETKAKVEEAIKGEDLSDKQKWKKAQEIKAEEQKQNEDSIQEDLKNGRQAVEDVNNAVDPTGGTVVVDVPPQNQPPGETIAALVNADKQGRNYLDEHERTHGENQQSAEQSTTEREAAEAQQAVEPSEENKQALENAQNKEDQAKETLGKSENTLKTLRQALDNISQLLSDLDARIHNLTKAELKSLKELSADVRGLEVKQLKYSIVFKKRLSEYMDDLYEHNKHIDRLENYAKTGGISRESLTEEEQKKVTISIAILIKQAEKTNNKKFLKLVHKLRDSKKLDPVLIGKIRDGIGAHLDNIFTSIKESDAYEAHDLLNKEIKEKLEEIALINNLSLARESRLSSRRFDRIASARGVALHQKHIKAVHKRRRSEFEGEARTRGKDGKFTRQELFEAVGPEGETIGAWISPLSQARRNYFNAKNKLQGKARSKFLKHEFTVEEARQELKDAIEEVEARLITEKPGSIIGEAIRARKKAGVEASTIAEEYIPVADVTADDRTAQSSPGMHSVIGTPIVPGGRVKGYVDLEPTGKDIIVAFQADLSTAVHELGHIVRSRILKGNDLVIIENHLGVKNKIWTTDNEERFAKLFEKYFVDNEAPKNATEELKSVFKKIATVLGKIYRTLLGKESINSEVKEVFDRLIQNNEVTGSYDVNSKYAQTIAAATGMTEGEIGAVLGLMEALGIQQNNVTWKKGTQKDVEFLYKALALQEEGEAGVATFATEALSDVKVLTQGDVRPINTETSNFKTWFEGTHPDLRDGDGPLALYHGTTEGFEALKPSDAGAMGPGIYLTSSPKEAGGYALGGEIGGEATAREGAQTIPVYVNLTNPLRLEGGALAFTMANVYNESMDAMLVARREGGPALLADKVRAEVKRMSKMEMGDEAAEVYFKFMNSLGYDGIVYRQMVQGEHKSTVVIAFDPANVKSPFNRGTWGLAEPRMLLQSDETFDAQQTEEYLNNHWISKLSDEEQTALGIEWNGRRVEQERGERGELGEDWIPSWIEGVSSEEQLRIQDIDNYFLLKTFQARLEFLKRLNENIAKVEDELTEKAPPKPPEVLTPSLFKKTLSEVLRKFRRGTYKKRHKVIFEAMATVVGGREVLQQLIDNEKLVITLVVKTTEEGLTPFRQPKDYKAFFAPFSLGLKGGTIPGIEMGIDTKLKLNAYAVIAAHEGYHFIWDTKHRNKRLLLRKIWAEKLLDKFSQTETGKALMKKYSDHFDSAVEQGSTINLPILEYQLLLDEPAFQSGKRRGRIRVAYSRQEAALIDKEVYLYHAKRQYLLLIIDLLNEAHSDKKALRDIQEEMGRPLTWKEAKKTFGLRPRTEEFTSRFIQIRDLSTTVFGEDLFSDKQLLTELDFEEARRQGGFAKPLRNSFAYLLIYMRRMEIIKRAGIKIPKKDWSDYVFLKKLLVKAPEYMMNFSTPKVMMQLMENQGLTIEPLTPEIVDFMGETKEKGYFYHGTTAHPDNLTDIFNTSIGAGLHITTNPFVAGRFTEGDYGRVYLLYARAENPLRVRDIDNFKSVGGLATAIADALIPHGTTAYANLLAMRSALKEEILTKITKEWHYRIETKKWSRRKYMNKSSHVDPRILELRTEVIQDIIKSYGYDSLVYLNRGEIRDRRTGKEPENLYNKMAKLRAMEFDRTGEYFSEGRDTRYLHSITDDEFRAEFPEATDSYIIFNPSHVKSAIANNGDFDLNKSSILMQTADLETQHLIDEATAWASWVEGLRSISINAKKFKRTEGKRYTESYRIWGTMPGFFRDIRKGPHITFKPALLDQEEQGTSFADVINHRNEETNYYDIDKVIMMAEYEHTRAVGRLQGWHKVARQDLLEALENDLMAGDAINYFVALEFITRVEKAFRPLYKEAKGRYGFISHLKEDTGEPVFLTNKHDVQAFTEIVRRAIKSRLDEYIASESGHRDLNKLEPILGILGYTRDKDFVSLSIDHVTSMIIKHMGKLTPEGEQIKWSIEAFGNGEIDWAPAVEIGAGLVDLLTGSPLAVQRGIESNVLHNEDIRTEEQDPGGESIRLRQTRRGESNRSAPISLFHLASVVNQYRFMKRINYLLQHDEFTPEQREAVEAWIEKVNSEGTPNPLGFRAGFRVSPHYMGGFLDQVIPSKETLTEWGLTFLLDLPNLAHSVIHDQISVSQNNPLRFRGDLKNFSEDFSHGDDIILPFHWWGEVLSYEQMSPTLEGLSEGLLDYEAARYREWREANPDLSITDLFSVQTHVDRTGSGRWEMKALSLAADPGAIDALVSELKDTHGTKTISKEIKRDGLFNTILTHRGFNEKDLSDHYLGLALEVAQLITSHRNHEIVKALGPMLTAFGQLDGITTVEELIERSETNDIIKTLRKVFKVPAMRFIYEGTMRNFKKEFILANKGKAREAILELGELLGYDFYGKNHEELEALATILYKVGVNNMSIALQEASLGTRKKPSQVSITERGTGISHAMRTAVMKYLSLNRSTDANITLIPELAEGWKAVIKAKSLEDPKSGTGVEAIVVNEETGAEHRVSLDITEISDKPQEADKKNSLIKADEALKLFEAALKKAAIYDFGEDVDFEEAMEKTRERYTNWSKIQAYLKERRNRFLTIGELNELKAMAYPSTPQTDMAVFRGLNMLGAATYQINLERAQLLADAMGIAGFDAEIQLASMMNKNMYFPVGYSTMSDRGYPGLQIMSTLTGIALERAAVRPLRIRDNTTGKMVAFPYKSFEEFIKAKQEAFEATGGVWDKAKLRETFKEFLRDVENAEESLGLYDTADNPFHKLSREDAKKKVEDLITLQQFIWWASYEAPPASVFPDYTTEVSDEALLQELQEDWTSHSERMYKELPREMEIEVNDASDQELKLKGKASLIRSNEASKKTGYPIQLYHRSEVDDSRYIDSSNPKGFMSTQPLYQSLPFHDRGILAFQRRALQNKVDSLLGPIAGLREVIAPIPGVDNSLGWASPWSEKTLPARRTTLAEYLQLYGKNEEGMLAGTIARDLDTWASRRGLLNELHDKPEFYPYYFLIREIEKTYQRFVKYARSEMSEEELIFRRSEWLTALHKLDEVSRNIVEYEHSGLTLDGKASLLALVRPIHDKATWKEILTSTVTEDHAEGKLLSPTLIHTELKAPLMPSEGTPIFETAEDKAYWDEHIGEAHWKDIVNELTIGSGIIQAHDFNRFLMVPLYQSYISEVLKTYKRPDGTKPYADSSIYKDPRKWEEAVERQDRKEIIRRAKNIARGSKGVSIMLDISVVEYADENNPDGPNLVKLMVESAVGQTVQKGKTKTEVSFNSRHASAEVGFGFLSRSPRIYKLIGGRFKIHLTPEGALKLFGITDNIRPLDELQNAAISNKIFGVKFDQNNEPLRAKPLQDIIRDAIGFTTRHQIEEATRISDALNLIVRQSRADKSQGPRMISHKQVTIDQFGLDVVDLHAYKTGEIAPPEGRTLAWREAVLSPITEFLHSIEEENLFNPYFDIHAELTSLIKRVREDVGPSYQHALGISIALSSLMINGASRIPSDSMIIPFLDPQIYNTRRIADSGKVDIDPLINEAQALYRKLVIFQDSDSFIKTLPVYHAARTFAFEMSLDPAADIETSTEEVFINWLKEKGLYEFDLGQPAKSSFLEFEAGRDTEPKIYYSYNQHLENYKPGLSDEEKRRQLILLSLDAALSHQETANNLRVEFDQTNLDSEESELDTLKSVFLGNVSKDHDTALKFAETRDNITRPHLRRVLKKIQGMEERGIVKGKETRLLRQLILNAYAMNPLIVRDLMFDLEAHSIKSGKTEEGQYYIRFGERLKRIGKDPLDIVQIFAHEVSHIARAKFISSNSGEWDAFQALLRGRGKGLVKKLVMAWHGNRWNSSAQEEYNNYVTKGPEEFIAALGQFFLLKDMLPTIKNMTTEEAKTLQTALGFVGRIMSFVRNVFSDLDHVWSRFFVSNDEVNILMHRLFGLDITTPNYSQVLDVENTGPLTFNWMNRFTDDDWQLSEGQRGTMEEIDARFEDAVDHRNILEMMQEKGTITDEQLRKLNSLRNMTDRRLESGISIFEFYDHLPHTMAKFGTDVSMGDHTWQVLDLEAVLDSSLGNSTEIQLDRIVAFQYGVNQMRHKFGNQIQDNAGEFAMRMSKALGKLGRFMGLGRNRTVDEDPIRTRVLSGIAGHTGNEYTWAAPHIIPIWLTTLIDEHITNTRGHYDTLEGLPSLRKSLEEVVNVENVLFRLHGVLQNEILSPLASFIKGDNTPGKKTREILKEVSAAFTLLVENETETDLGFSEETKIRLANLSPKKRELFYSTIKEMAQVMRSLMENIQKSRQDLGDWTSAADSLMGYKLSQEIKQGTNSSTMFDAMNEEIHNRLLDNTHDFVDPLTLFAMNALPRFDTTENLTEDLFGPKGLYGNKTEPSSLYVLLISQLAKTMDETFSSEEKVLNASLDPVKQTKVDDFVRKFKTLFEDGVLKEKYLSGFRITIQKLMRDMASGEITWSNLNIAHVDKLKFQYHHYLKESGGKDATHDMRVDKRFQSLFLNRDSLSFLEQSRGAIAFEMPQGRMPLLEERSLTTGKIYNVTQLHTRNFMNRAYMGHYLPNDAWWIPKVSQAIRNPIIRENLTLHPVETIRSLKKGLADTTHERMILQYHLGMRGDIGHLLALFKYFNQVGDLHDMAGNKASESVRKAMTKSVEFLEQKYTFLRGFQEEGTSYGTMADWAFEMAPSVTKIAFAGNLGIASLTVEHMMNTFVTMIGEKKLLDGFRTMFAPVFHGLSSEETKLVASDIADAVEGMTQGFLPEYEQAASEAEAVFGQDFTNKWASQMLRFPKHVLRSSATARIITLRKGIYSLLHSNPAKIKVLLDHIEKNPLKEPGDLERAVRKSKISWWSYGKILTYLQRSGLLHPDRTENLAVVLELGNVKDKFYTIGKVVSQLSARFDGKSDSYRNYMSILSALRHVERQYLNEVVVSPNAFDIYTGSDRRSRAAEIFRRFPVLWASQMMIRRSNNMPLLAYGTFMVSMLTLDMIYMMSLRLAAGTSYEDLMKEIEDKGFGKFMLTYGARLPLWGRYYGWIAAAAVALSRDNRIEGGFVPAAAMAQILQNMYKLGMSPWTDDYTQQDLINASRILPILGDTLVRLSVYSAWGDQISKKNRSRRGYGSPSSQFQYTYTHMGVPPEYDSMSYEAVMGEWFNEMGLEPDFLAYENQFKTLPGTRSNWEQMEQETHIDPEKAARRDMPSRPSEILRSPEAGSQRLTVDPIEAIKEEPILEIPEEFR